VLVAFKIKSGNLVTTQATTKGISVLGLTIPIGLPIAFIDIGAVRKDRLTTGKDVHRHFALETSACR